MKSVSKRIDEFVKYHIFGDGECNNVVLKAWAEERGLNLQGKYELAYFFSITYCVESAIVMFENRSKMLSDISVWVKENKGKLVFQSDRKYIRMKDSFERCLRYFEQIRNVEKFLKIVSDNGRIILAKAVPYVSSWDMFGRFSAFLFLETFSELTGIDSESTTIEWKKGNTATSGLLNVYGLDDAADEFDKSGRLLVREKDMDRMLLELSERIKRDGGDSNVTKVETSLCAYRKFYKASRYNGYYIDRMLEEIYGMQDSFPSVSKELFNIRERRFQKKWLGEASGWKGIRKNMKKYYLITGEVNW